ncbi:unnamed protein product [Effrenium voratum]|nr:unnamed protein product [Effrenium voratum]
MLPCNNKATTGLGRFQAEDASHVDVLARLNCDGQRQCLQLLFSRERKTLGYIPTEVKEGSFVLRGMWVNQDLRCKGLASMFLALWLQLCDMLEVTPLTERIHKPILSLVLQKFGFVAGRPHLRLQVSRSEDERMVVWSPQQPDLSSYFSLRAQRDQGIVLADECPQESRTAFVNTIFSVPDTGMTRSAVAQVLQGGHMEMATSDRAASLLQDLHGGGWPSWAPRPRERSEALGDAKSETPSARFLAGAFLRLGEFLVSKKCEACFSPSCRTKHLTGGLLAARLRFGQHVLSLVHWGGT